MVNTLRSTRLAVAVSMSVSLLSILKVTAWSSLVSTLSSLAVGRSLMGTTRTVKVRVVWLPRESSAVMVRTDLQVAFSPGVKARV